ncbi:hypothetical protein TH53_00430 [Pedobacter lusitanus]|uniref:Contig3, whole genome shotgun sequence n=1 Tax=Pedobacter lusitanus TaxID=1503925 RepID=A0A0D0GX20_9SPHI|nr:C1 family peptidase [Pedobacter lusitanus]KIO78991.1 hypothetical protein TH53_00430 [Pedobacter lusitanus]
MKNTNKFKFASLFSMLLILFCFYSCKKNTAQDSPKPKQGNSNDITSQKSFFSGFIATPKEILDKLPKLNGDKIAITESIFPTTFSLRTPPIQNQGQTGTCVAWATTYCAWSIENLYRSKNTVYNTGVNVFSPGFIYNQLSANCNTGISTASALEALKNQGACTYQTLPFSTDCSNNVTPLQRDSARLHRIANVDYYVIDKATRQNTALLKMLIYQKHPIIFATAADDNMNTQPVWNRFGSPRFSYDGFLTPGNIGRNVPVGHHAMAIIGYDDNRHAFKVQNSWGSAWGDAGFLWIDYDFFGSGQYLNAVLTYNNQFNTYGSTWGFTVNDVITEAYVISDIPQ